jgi:class 3 adenylate cyclase
MGLDQTATARSRTGLRFARPEVEQQYRRWRVARTIPFARTGYVGSIPSWSLALVAILVVDPDASLPATLALGGWVATLVALTGLTYLRRLRPAIMPMAAAANLVAGCLAVWLLDDVTLSSETAQTRAGVMVAALIVVMFFGFGVFRIPPGIAVLAVTPYAGYATYQVLEDRGTAGMTTVGAVALVAALWIAYLGCLLVCVVTEVVERHAFGKDLLIRAQQEELAASRRTIHRYVPRAVLEHIEQGDTDGIDRPVRRRVTVLFADLVGFTELADRVEAEVLTEVVNDYMSRMSELVDEHGGLVNEFAGDGLMAIFGAPDEMEPEDQVTAAVGAARAMQAALPELGRRWRRLGVLRVLTTRIGINTGVLSVGSFGSEGRMTYTAIGLNTNIAARLQSACEPGEVLLSEASWALVRDEVPCELRGEVACKGVHFPVRAYAVSAPVPPPRRPGEELTGGVAAGV